MSELKRPNRDDYYDMLGGFMPVIWDGDIEIYIDKLELKLEALKEFAYEVCPLHREDDLEKMI